MGPRSPKSSVFVIFILKWGEGEGREKKKRGSSFFQGSETVKCLGLTPGSMLREHSWRFSRERAYCIFGSYRGVISGVFMRPCRVAKVGGEERVQDRSRGGHRVAPKETGR